MSDVARHRMMPVGDLRVLVERGLVGDKVLDQQIQTRNLMYYECVGWLYKSVLSDEIAALTKLRDRVRR